MINISGNNNASTPIINSVYNTDVGMENGLYGRYEYDAKSKKNYFVELGNEVSALQIKQNIDTDEIELVLEFTDITGLVKKIEFPRKNLTNTARVLEFSTYGVQVRKDTVSILIKTIENAETTADVVNIHSGIGWMKYQGRLVYRAYNAVGVNSQYKGDFDVKPRGSYKEWLRIRIIWWQKDYFVTIILSNRNKPLLSVERSIIHNNDRMSWKFTHKLYFKPYFKQQTVHGSVMLRRSKNFLIHFSSYNTYSAILFAVYITFYSLTFLGITVFTIKICVNARFINTSNPGLGDVFNFCNIGSYFYGVLFFILLTLFLRVKPKRFNSLQTVAAEQPKCSPISD